MIGAALHAPQLERFLAASSVLVFSARPPRRFIFNEIIQLFDAIFPSVFKVSEQGLGDGLGVGVLMCISM